MSNYFNETITIKKGTALYVGAVLGSGILILPGMTASVAEGNAIVSWLVMISLSIPLAFTFAFLSIEYPSAGGIATFSEKAFGKNIGAIIGWSFFIAGSVGQIVVSMTGGMYIVKVFALSSYFTYVIALLILSISIGFNLYGLKMSGLFQVCIGVLTFFILIVTIISSLPYIEMKNINIHFSMHEINPILNASLLIFWSFFGWEAIASLAPEFKTPRKRNVIFSTGFAIIIIGILYIGIALSVIGTKSYHINADNTTALVLVIKQTLGVQFAWVIGFVAFIICLGTTNAFIASMGRLGYSLGKEEIAPRYLAHINEKRENPTNAVKVVGCIAIIGLLISFVFQISIENIVLIPNSLGIITYIVGAAAGMKLIKNKLGKVFSVVAFTCCIVVYPFIGGVILIPLAVSFICLCYLRFRNRR
ncbi:transporter [Bacillus thuringiensis]|uniref:Transporter n=7 Tax=Bacillus cereus group TaxID=86661 RepID=A0A0J1I5A6_BACAN|nr:MULTISPECIES: amino acid permease [Bacillus]ACO27743.1 amino acid permease [Bacillus cereus 03BB102]AJG54295.1 amino acid permease family protein [Bacillus cereus 03BB102]AJI10131.1 amino acid permease family protein [Bacillus cereus 03BB108]AUD21093.1 amino acid permease [Bacillus sp. HBCD-sjtu]AXO98880.1 amino acid permease [Bacillus anthracis]